MTTPSTTAPGVALGERLGPFPGVLDADLVRRYAAATRDPNAAPQSGTAVPPVAIVTQIWDAQQAAFAGLVPDHVRASMTGGVHGEHDVVLHRPIVPGEALSTWVEAHGSRRGGKHNLVTMRYSTYDERDALVAEQWWTTVLLNASGDPIGDAAPEHTFPEDARTRPAGDYRVDTDDDMPRRYAEVSRDWSGHHFDVDVARAERLRAPVPARPLHDGPLRAGCRLARRGRRRQRASGGSRCGSRHRRSSATIWRCTSSASTTTRTRSKPSRTARPSSATASPSFADRRRARRHGQAGAGTASSSSKPRRSNSGCSASRSRWNTLAAFS